MPNIFDYMNWRGDLTLLQDRFNDIDNLILSRLSYAPFDGIVPEECGQGVSISEAASQFKNNKELHKLLVMKEDADLLLAVADCDRFKDMLLHCYVNHFDPERQKQFSAVTIELGNGSIFVSYRGTDASLLGWKEDFNMSFMRRVPSQEAAVYYLEQVASHFTGGIRVGGHSKGGNLAVYASAFCEKNVQDRILHIYSNDGPGLHADIIALPGYQGVRERISAFVPQSTVVGMLLEYDGKYTIVKSSYIGLFQHDLYSWEVMGSNFITLQTITPASVFMDSTIKSWLEKMNEEQRSIFIESLYNIISATNAKTFSELTDKWYNKAATMLKMYISMDDEMRKMISYALSSLVKSASENISIITPELPALPWKAPKE